MNILFPGLALAPELYVTGFPKACIIDPWVHPWSTASPDLLIAPSTYSRTLIGHSLGGLVALEWALMHPELVDHLLLLDPTTPSERPPSRAEHALLSAMPALTPALVPLTMPTLAPFISSSIRHKRYRGSRNIKFLLDELRNAHLRQSRVATLLKDHPLPAHIRTTILIGAGNGTEHEFLSEQHQLAQTLNATLIHLWGEGHLFPLRHPELVAPFVPPNY
ncbi:alpha/beta hydrolase [Arcanobacterium phocisimile]|uniref:Alpha/beta hydrolase n=1 Tax=Arcanobacterium phocisimile TaxID=1302235 RepID=A0ABX7IFI9_9ACTO|nr:alpha/beta hydrolase [Arcanobacterium phocisimile]QRV01515.1 alpha/beta hydrolase [Arcanobacterium phocisimile]